MNMVPELCNCKVNAWAFISMIGGMVIGFYRTLGHCFH